MDDDKRTRAITFSATAAEIDVIDRAAGAEGLSLASASRRATLLWAKAQNAQAATAESRNA